MHVGYCEVYSYSFRSFFDDWSQSSWNIRYEGKKVPQEEQFHAGNEVLATFVAKVLATFVPEERKERNESSTGAKVQWTFRCRKRKCKGTKSPSFDRLTPTAALSVCRS